MTPEAWDQMGEIARAAYAQRGEMLWDFIRALIPGATGDMDRQYPLALEDARALSREVTALRAENERLTRERDGWEHKAKERADRAKKCAVDAKYADRRADEWKARAETLVSGIRHAMEQMSDPTAAYAVLSRALAATTEPKR